MYTISKDFAWSASHVLDGLPKGHQCGRLHGHNYVARIELSGHTLDSMHTSALRGVFRSNDAARAEFLALTRSTT